jgi:hypothetical protein
MKKQKRVWQLGVKMLITQKNKRCISLLFVLFLIFTVIPGAYINAECPDSCAPESPVIFSADTVCMDIAILIPDVRKTSCYQVSEEIYDCLEPHICFADNSQNKSTYFKALTDYRKEIQRAIPHYFHGGKYKKVSFFV